MTNIKEAISDRGYYVIEGAIPEEYVKIFKKTIVDYFSGPNTAVEGNTAQPNALNNEKLFALHDIFSLNTLMGPMRELLDNEVCFLHNFDVHHNFLALGWHDDTQIRHLTEKPPNYSFLEENLTDAPPFKVYNLAVYLQDHPDARALSVYAGSHKNGKIPHRTTVDKHNLLHHGQTIENVSESDSVSVPLKAGEASLHHGWTMHTSYPNESSNRRIGLTINYISTDMYQTQTDNDSAMLVRGVDEYKHFAMDEPPTQEFDEAAWIKLQQKEALIHQTYNKMKT